MLRIASKNRRQAEYDLSYARAGLEEIESHLRFLDLKIQNQRLEIEQRREKGQWRIECFLTFIGIFMGIGGATTNMPQKDDSIRLVTMFAGAVIITVTWRVPTRSRK